MTSRNEESTTGLVSDALSHMSKLLRLEVDLARSEVNENTKKAGIAIGMIAAALVVALSALNVLTAALVVALTELGIDAGWAALIVGVVLALVAWGFLSKGMGDLKLTSLAPTRTTENLKRDAQAVRGTSHAE